MDLLLLVVILGIFITGPRGFLAGLAWGVFCAATDPD
jgi:hypothetical protein